jgi:F-type H+-transporting ATPase subunit epsilon
MKDAAFLLRIVTPAGIRERQITHLRLSDATASFGVLKGHTDFLTVLVPSLGYYHDGTGREVFLAVDGGILSVRAGRVTLTSRQVFEGEAADRLAAVIDNAAAGRRRKERALVEMLTRIERSFTEKAASILK